MDGCILYPEQYSFIWKASFFSLFSCIYAFYNNHYDLALVPGGVFLTSINYWYKPDYSWRRYVDMGVVYTSLIYQFLRAYNAEYSKIYYVSMCFAASFYPLGIYYYNKKQYWPSTYAHSMLHLIANISNVILYSGHIEPVTNIYLLTGDFIQNNMSNIVHVVQLLIKVNGVYDILCALSILRVVNIPYLDRLHLSMIKNNSENPLFERFLAYWIFTYGIMRLSVNNSFIVSGSYFLEALFFANELFKHRSVYVDKALFVIFTSLLIGYISSFY
jgi:hypothetical protein